ncbi:MAG TPA: hypothetical protein VEZ70_06365 [Allosphingosinicella sp.]|nr:hypothetical protein [Allosphingosinicella sp.]
MVSSRLGFRIGIAAALAAAASPAPAQLFFNDPDFKPAPIDGSDALVGQPIPGATPAEQRAHLLWNLRSGLNVAALQCQFSPWLRAVPNYNAILAHHSAELASAYTVLNGYFKRIGGTAAGMKAFDDYSTSTYNNFSTLQAQLGFCQVAADIAKNALNTPKGQLLPLAERRMRELRNSLVPLHESGFGFNPYAINLPALPTIGEDCWDKKGQLKKKCRAGG